MTRGQAMWAGICDSLNIDPAERGTQKAVHAQCADLATQAQLSEWSTGKREPSPRKVQQLCQRFGFRLVATWSWEPASWNWEPSSAT